MGRGAAAGGDGGRGKGLLWSVSCTISGSEIEEDGNIWISSSSGGATAIEASSGVDMTSSLGRRVGDKDVASRGASATAEESCAASFFARGFTSWGTEGAPPR